MDRSSVGRWPWTAMADAEVRARASVARSELRKAVAQGEREDAQRLLRTAYFAEAEQVRRGLPLGV